MAELKSIRNAKWQIEKTGDMKVPVTIYGTDAIASMMKDGRTFGQAMNVAKLPGIVRSSFVMPDGHEGYGFPIGGVAAFDPENGGVVSPGGVGYDINCLSAGSKILTEFGFTMPIEKFAEMFRSFDVSGNYLVSVFGESLSVSSLSGKKLEAAKPVAFLSKKADKRMLEIATRSGKKLTCSEDHPILTRNGMIVAGKLEKGSEIGVSFFDGIELEGNANAELALYSKILGYMLGDGALSESNGKLRACAYGQLADLNRMKEDVERLGFHAHIIERERKHSIETQYGRKDFIGKCAELHVYSREFAERLIALGMPVGKKASGDYEVPQWVKGSPMWVKRLFLAGFFGAELSSPATHTKTGFYSPIISQNKNEANVGSGRQFLIDLMGLLEGFGVRTTKIAQRDEHRNKQGKTVRLRLEISGEEGNLLKLYQTVGFEYSEKKRRTAEIACFYALRKKELLSKRREIARKTRELRGKGLSLRETQNLLCSEFANARFIERAYYEKGGQRIYQKFESFASFRKRMSEEIDAYGVLFDEIADSKEVPYSGEVYDFCIEGTHNFIANGIVVSNCGVRLILTNLKANEVRPKVGDLMNHLFKNVPSGVGSKSKLRLERNELAKAVEMGVMYVIDKGYGWPEDAKHIEENGRLPGADATKVSDMAMKRGMPQFGTLGAGNHFLEVQDVETILDEEVAKAYGLEKGNAVVMLHCGSRGFGHQICDDYIRVMMDASKKYGISLPDRELCCAPLGSKEAEDYLGAMACAVNYAFCNRQVMTHWIRETFAAVFGRKADELGMKVVYDVCHNIAKWENHDVDGKTKRLCVHRKGATRAMGPGREEVPVDYRNVGQPVLIPGSMGTASYVLAGAEGASECFFSTCHGSGRVMSRSQAIRTYKGESVKNELEGRGIAVRATDYETISEEAPGAYKDVDEVVKSVAEAGISKIVARLVPMGVAKG